MPSRSRKGDGMDIFFHVRGSYVALLMTVIIGCSAVGMVQDDKQSGSVTLPFSVHVTHLLGFEGVKSNAHGTLTVEDDSLSLYTGGLLRGQVKIASLRAVSVGEE